MIEIPVVLTLVALFLALKRKGSKYKTSLYICVLNILIFGYIVIDMMTCKGYMCGLDSGIFGSIITLITGIVAIFFASKGKSTKNTEAANLADHPLVISPSGNTTPQITTSNNDIPISNTSKNNE